MSIVTAPVLAAVLCLGIDALSAAPVIGDVGAKLASVQAPWRHALVAFGLVVLAEALICSSACPLVRYADRQGRLLLLTLRNRDAHRAHSRRNADELRERSLSRLSSAFAHEMNNVLAAILADADAADDVSDDPALRAATASIVANVQTGLEIGKRMVAFGESIALVPKVGDLNVDLLDATDRLAEAAGGRSRLLLRLGHRPLPIDVDHEHLLSCVVELLDNARTATPIDSQIAVRTRTEFGEDRQRPDRLVAVLEVEDAGRGMDERECGRALSPYYTTKPGGLGLGLPMVERFVIQSGGSLAIQSRPKRGTRMTLRFPVVEAPAKPVPPRPASRASADAKGRVLVVDDNAAVRGGIVRGLQRIGFTVSEGEDAASARAALDQGVDAVITDVVLPDMDGFALARHARTRDPAVALVFMSGFISARQPELLANDELATFMRKPIDLDKLADVLAGLLSAREDKLALNARV